eukprot:gene5807-biopygen23772
MRLSFFPSDVCLLVGSEAQPGSQAAVLFITAFRELTDLASFLLFSIASGACRPDQDCCPVPADLTRIAARCLRPSCSELLPSACCPFQDCCPVHAVLFRIAVLERRIFWDSGVIFQFCRPLRRMGRHLGIAR